MRFFYCLLALVVVNPVLCSFAQFDVLQTWQLALKAMETHHALLYDENITHITLSVSDMKYVHGFRNWFYMTGSQGRSLSVVVALDMETCKHMTLYRYAHLCLEAPLFSVRTRTTMAKILGPLAALSIGKIVTFSEQDVFWQHNPALFLSKSRADYDIQMSPHVNFPSSASSPNELNFGFFYAQPTTASVMLFRYALEYSTEHMSLTGTPTWDQKLFDHLIREVRPPSEEAPQWSEQFPQLQHPQWTLRWNRLPGTLFTHNNRYNFAFRTDTITQHISWGVESSDDRLQCAYALGIAPLFNPLSGGSACTPAIVHA